MIVADGKQTSYSAVIVPPGMDLSASAGFEASKNWSRRSPADGKKYKNQLLRPRERKGVKNEEI
ncbi:hypothetical protein DWZ56_02000 [Lachnotalea sp. AF33-28]|nr:hypothetical protein DWZ56_02000 [Lachnotalea sp. AF33-28]